MSESIRKVIMFLSKHVNDSNFQSIAEDKVDELDEIDANGESVEALLRLIEDNPGVDFGAPGPFVHFVEKFYQRGYEDQLLASIRRAPNSHNLWMLNRLINGVEGDMRQRYIRELELVLSRNDVHVETKKIAADFLELHKDK